MAVAIATFSVDLTSIGTETYTFTTSIGASFELGQVLLHTADDSDSDIPDGNRSPVYRGLQERVELWFDNSAGEDYDTLIDSVSLNGRRNLIWPPAGGLSYYFNSGSELRLVISNKHKLGTIYGSVVTNTV